MSHSLQLQQVKKFNHSAALEAAALYLVGRNADAGAVIVAAMQAELTRRTDPVEAIWQRIKSILETRQTPVIARSQVEVGRIGNKTIVIFMRSDGKLALYDGLSRTTPPIAVWGKDNENISSAYSGKWHLTDNARGILGVMLAPQEPSARQWRKSGGQWYKK